VRRGEAMATPALGEPPGAVGGPISVVICIVKHDVIMSGGWYVYKKVYRTCAVVVKATNLNMLISSVPFHLLCRVLLMEGM